MNTSYWTYGAEHELGDWPRDRFPELAKLDFTEDVHDVTVMSSNGIAADPRGISYRFGGEICTPPSLTPAGQALALSEILRIMPEATVNHRSNLHIHVRIPGLRDDLAALKRIAAYGFRYLGQLLEKVEPIPVPQKGDYGDPDEHAGAVRRYKRRLVSHHTIVTYARLQAQLAATTPEEFFAAECPRSKDGRVQWHLAPRHAVNLRHLREPTDTVEFRHFPGTLKPFLVANCAAWCRDYLVAALEDRDPEWLFTDAGNRFFPKFPAYVHWREVNYRLTCHDGTLSRAQIEANIQRILQDQGMLPRP